MTRILWVPAVLLAIGGAAVFTYLGNVSTEPNSQELPGQLSTVTHSEESDVNASTLAGASTNPEPSAPAPQHKIAAETVAKWISEATGDDADARDAAIDALATVPKMDALPVLQKVLSEGFDVDRQLAVNSLHTLALDQGDDDGAVRNVLRLAMYDGNDESTTISAQAALDDIERQQPAPHLKKRDN